MQSSAIFSVETSSPKALILGSSSPLIDPLISALKLSSIEASALPLTACQSNFSPDDLLEIDYLVIIPDLAFLSWLQTAPGKNFWDLLLSFPLDQPRLVLIAPLTLAPELPSPNSHVRICLFGEYFATSFSFAPTLEKFYSEAIATKTLTIPGDGLQEYHLLHGEDLVQGLLKSLFSSNYASPLTLLNPQPISLLSLAYSLRASLTFKIAILFDENISWSGGDLNLEQIIDAQAQISWTPEKNLATELSIFLKNYTPPSPAKSPSISSSPHPPKLSISTPPFPKSPIPPSPTRLQPLTTLLERFHESPSAPEFVLKNKPPRRLSLRRPKTRPSHPLRSLFFHSILTATFLYLFSLLFSLVYSFYVAKSILSEFESGNYQPTKNVVFARGLSTYLEANLFVLRSFPGVSSLTKLTELNSLLLAYHQGLDVLALSIPLIDTGQTLFTAIFSDQQIDLTSHLSSSRLQVADLYQSLSLFDGALPTEPPSVFSARYRDQYSLFKTTLQTLKHQTLVFKSLLEVLPDLLGVGERRKYALLFQNNMELRATGGFIGSFALPSFENGKLYDLPIYDVYAADGQLKGHVEPPAPITKYLGEANWYLRDSNWDPDFPTSARRAEWFLSKTLNEDVSGVIAINLETLSAILQALGPVTLPDYNEEINAENLFPRAEYYAEINFFPGSTQKKEFLSSVTTALISTLPTLSRDQSLELALALLKSIDQKNTLISLSDPDLNATFSLLGWNGELRDLPCPVLTENTCFNDYAMLVDSNFGVNKANYFLSRKLELVITIDKNRLIKHRLTTTYQNNSTSGAWPAGSYKNYSRLYLPRGSVISAVALNGKPLPREAFTTSTEHNRLVVGFLVEVPISSSVVVDLDYEVGVLPENSPAYTFYWQKQSGTQADPLTIYLNYPLYLNPLVVSPSASLNEQQLQFDLTNITDRRITVQFE